MRNNRPAPFEVVNGICNDCRKPFARISTELRCECETSELRQEIEDFKKALEESVKLQSHYAGILNMYDGGQRIEFKDADEWVKRLREIENDNK